ncbi:MgtC/SapB family protein [Sulfuricurvum sp.]|uniref:MgtC/SapB family protein n=1 Tax=Sulfuricurvum sp. TaxID=2025608 RepID=UPI003BB19429
MYESILELYQTDYFRFLLTVVLSFLTGLELREYKRTLKNPYFIGTVRTYTLIGILGYIFYILDPTYRFYLAGFGVLSLLLGLFYYHKLQGEQKGIISILVSLLVYTYAPIIMTQPLWFTALVFVSVIFVVNAKTQVQLLIQCVDNTELVTFAKLVLLSVVIWPLLPTTPISPWIPMSLSKVWMAVVVVSGISYIGYLLQRYFFQEKGFLVNGVLGGIYSSTATTVVLSRNAKVVQSDEYTFTAAIILATGMMHVRLIVIIGFLNAALLQMLFIPLASLGALALIGGFFLSRLKQEVSHAAAEYKPAHVNPLELGVALVFAIMFVVMSMITHYFITDYGISGLHILSLIIGFTDIDPFILSLINGAYPIDQKTIVSAILIAIGSNNLFKGFSALILASRKVGWMSLGALGALSLVTFVIAYTL